MRCAFAAKLIVGWLFVAHPGADGNLTAAETAPSAKDLFTKINVFEEQLKSHQGTALATKASVEYLSIGAQLVSGGMSPVIADEIALELFHRDPPPLRAQSYLRFWRLRAIASIGADDQEAGVQAADVLTALGARSAMDESVHQTVAALRLKGWLTARGKADLSKASTMKPFVNSLGMKFVPIHAAAGPSKGMILLFSAYETRMKDYAVYATVTADAGEAWMEGRQKRQWAPDEPEFPLTPSPDSPVVLVSWDDAIRFCRWLTTQEQKSGLIGRSERYRLPMDHEWSDAVGIGNEEDPAADPLEKGSRRTAVYPWGKKWPPPKLVGNLADETLASAIGWNDPSAYVSGYRDGYIATAPVGSFRPNRFGLYDMAGNVHEWCLDIAKIDAAGIHRVGRSTCYRMGKREELLSSYRKIGDAEPRCRDPMTGFRVVLVGESR